MLLFGEHIQQLQEWVGNLGELLMRSNSDPFCKWQELQKERIHKYRTYLQGFRSFYRQVSLFKCVFDCNGGQSVEDKQADRNRSEPKQQESLLEIEGWGDLLWEAVSWMPCVC